MLSDSMPVRRGKGFLRGTEKKALQKLERREKRKSKKNELFLHFFEDRFFEEQKFFIFLAIESCQIELPRAAPALSHRRPSKMSLDAAAEATAPLLPAAADENAPCIDLSALKRAKLLWPSSSSASPSSTPATATAPAHLFEPNAVVCLYFSASWCPPCRAFSPRLATAYEKMKRKCAGNAKKNDGDDGAGGGGGKGTSSSTSTFLPTATETFLVGFDRNRGDYERYAEQMPFPAIAWDDEAGAREQLAAAAGLSGIPQLLLVRGSDGKILTTDGKTRVLRDPELSKFPWEGVKPATSMLPQWLQWVLFGVFYLGMRFLAKHVRGWLGW